MKLPEISVGVNVMLNKTYQLLVYVDDVNLLQDNRITIKKYTEVFTDARKEVGLEENTEKTDVFSSECRVVVT
jgi:hypothetical protein